VTAPLKKLRNNSTDSHYLEGTDEDSGDDGGILLIQQQSEIASKSLLEECKNVLVHEAQKPPSEVSTKTPVNSCYIVSIFQSFVKRML
jgi:hypothetical protein